MHINCKQNREDCLNYFLHLNTNWAACLSSTCSGGEHIPDDNEQNQSMTRVSVANKLQHGWQSLKPKVDTVYNTAVVNNLQYSSRKFKI